jgi:multiple sugar transport system permease protein
MEKSGSGSLIKRRYKSRDNAVGYLMLAPWLIGFAFMWLAPAITSVYYSFTNFNLLNTPKLIGFSNYVRIFTADKTFYQALKVTFIYVLILVPLRLAFALFIAVLLNKKHRCLGLYRTVYYIPSVIGGSIAVSIVWKELFGNKGVIMSLLETFGVHQRTSFLGNPQTALGVIILMGIWQFGSSMLIFLAALKQIPNSIYESAMVDGARPIKIFWKITMPMLTPTIFFNLIYQMVNAFRMFTESYIITNGGPLDSTLTYVLYLYRRAFTYFDMGYSCALAWILVAIIAAFTVILFKTQKHWVYYETGGNQQ